MRKKHDKCLALFAVIIILLIPSSFVLAADKIAVIPLTRTVEAPIIPFGPLAKVSPSNTNYTIELFTVTDKLTGLVWQKLDDNVGRNWNDAWTYCHALTLLNKKDWRLPTIHELTSIVDYSAQNPTINTTSFPDTNSSFYWSATTLATDITSGFAWYVNFFDGSNGYHDKSTGSYVRCVR